MQLPAFFPPRNGSNAKKFCAWSGLKTDNATALVRQHLENLQEKCRSKNLASILGEIDESVVIIGSCKAVQCLQSLGL